MITLDYYDTRHKTAQSRILFCIAKISFGDFSAMAEGLHVPRQQIYDWFKHNRIPLKHVSFIARKFKFHPALLAYSKYILLGGEASFPDLLNCSKYFADDDRTYILGGRYETNRAKILKESDAGIKSK